jgi:hypothetical protein
MLTHAVIWIDHKEARVFHVHPEATEATTVLAPQNHLHRHPKGRGEAREHPDDARRFFGEVARALDGVESADHPTMEIVARAKRYFVASERMS